jgi:hypothetical protein
MSMTGLCLHCGGNLHELKDIAKVKTPEPEGKWHPIAHARFIETVRLALKHEGLEIEEEAHSLGRGGAHYFGLLRVARTDEDKNKEYGYVVGLRNAHDKQFTASLAAGNQVFVCDNLAFSGEVTLARKHTRHIEDDLPRLTADAVGKLTSSWHTMDERIKRYKQVQVTDSTAHDLVIRAMDLKIVTVTAIPAILDRWRGIMEGFTPEPTAWRFFNVLTGGQHGRVEPQVIVQRTTRLHGLMDAHVGFGKR